jgi:hypothetical protein
MDSIVHLTLNTGDRVEQHRAEVTDDAIRVLTPLVNKGGGRLPDPFSAFRVELARDPGDGWNSFTVYHGRNSIVECGLCWDVKDSRKLWDVICNQYLCACNTTAVDWTNAPTMPSTVPWLAVILLPGLLSLTRDDVLWLGDFERCLAFAIIESTPP